MGDDYRLYIRDESGPFLAWVRTWVEQSRAKLSKVDQS